MTITMTIKRHGSDEIITLSRDVRDTHPAWVHEQMGTTSESELQAALDQYSADDCTGERDVCGIAMSEDDIDALASAHEDACYEDEGDSAYGRPD